MVQNFTLVERKVEMSGARCIEQCEMGGGGGGGKVCKVKD